LEQNVHAGSSFRAGTFPKRKSRYKCGITEVSA
jgi:hypothetical protein